MGWLVGLAVGVITVLAAVIGTYFLGMRFKLGFAQKAVIAFTKHVVNPRMRRTAGEPGASAAVMRNVGRSSGRVYETPVGAEPIEGGFVIALPYGERPNWLRNVLAAGRATLVHQGTAFEVDRPEVVALEPFAGAFSAQDQKLHRAFHVDRALRVHLVSEVAGAAA